MGRRSRRPVGGRTREDKMGPLANGRKHWEGVQMVTVQEWLRARKARLQTLARRERGQAKGQQIQASRSAEEQSQEVQDPAATEEADGSGVSGAGQETEPQD